MCSHVQGLFLISVYRAPGKCLYVVARNFFLLLLNCSAWPCLGPAWQKIHTFSGCPVHNGYIQSDNFIWSWALKLVHPCSTKIGNPTIGTAKWIASMTLCCPKCVKKSIVFWREWYFLQCLYQTPKHWGSKGTFVGTSCWQSQILKCKQRLLQGINRLPCCG